MRDVSHYSEQPKLGLLVDIVLGKGSKSDRVLFFNMKFLVTGIQKAMQVQHIIRWVGENRWVRSELTGISS